MVAYAAILAIFILSADGEFLSVGKQTKIDYWRLFQMYKHVLIETAGMIDTQETMQYFQKELFSREQKAGGTDDRRTQGQNSAVDHIRRLMASRPGNGTAGAPTTRSVPARGPTPAHQPDFAYDFGDIAGDAYNSDGGWEDQAPFDDSYHHDAFEAGGNSHGARAVREVRGVRDARADDSRRPINARAAYGAHASYADRDGSDVAHPNQDDLRNAVRPSDAPYDSDVDSPSGAHPISAVPVVDLPRRAHATGTRMQAAGRTRSEPQAQPQPPARRTHTVPAALAPSAASKNGLIAPSAPRYGKPPAATDNDDSIEDFQADIDAIDYIELSEDSDFGERTDDDAVTVTDGEFEEVPVAHARSRGSVGLPVASGSQDHNRQPRPYGFRPNMPPAVQNSRQIPPAPSSGTRETTNPVPGNRAPARMLAPPVARAVSNPPPHIRAPAPMVRSLSGSRLIPDTRAPAAPAAQVHVDAYALGGVRAYAAASYPIQVQRAALATHFEADAASYMEGHPGPPDPRLPTAVQHPAAAVHLPDTLDAAPVLGKGRGQASRGGGRARARGSKRTRGDGAAARAARTEHADVIEDQRLPALPVQEPSSAQERKGTRSSARLRK
ncbi:hypothetical protein OH77DRAFT_195569 [Trametes cingulata]|nr:hypothetical protein OH77DRAFT_195569 [Trametes cingulata]